MKTDHSSLEADTGLLVERLGVVAPERLFELLDYALPSYDSGLAHISMGTRPPFAPWWVDEDVRLFLPRTKEWWGRI